MEADMFAGEHLGMWSTVDGAVRKLLLPNGRYLAMIADGEIRHQRKYRIVGTRIEYLDDEGKTGAGEFRDGVMVGTSGVPLYPKDALALLEGDEPVFVVPPVTSQRAVSGAL
jgi:hypothetical protein